MTLVHRVLYPRPIISLEDHVARGGGKGLALAGRMDPVAIIDKVLASGLRGRGGAGFPTGRKWQTVRENRSDLVPATVIVNAAEGEPGTFKDRTILRRNPYLVLEGSLVAARAVGADLVIFAMKQSFEGEIDRMREAIDQAEAAGWGEGVRMTIFEGPDEYLYGEESALLETIDGRWPFPRVVPTFRRGIGMATRADDAPAPALVNNTETIANVARIIARGPAWFRTVGTEQSPGTIVCTITGYTKRHGVGEVRMGTPLREVIDAVGGGARRGRRITAVMSGVANALIPASQLDAPVSYEGLAAAGSGLGSAAFIVLDDSVDMAAVAAGVARFLAVESCGQCSPCKLDGLVLAQRFQTLCESQAVENDARVIRKRLGTVADRSRCFLATQQQVVINSILQLFPEAVTDHLSGAAPAVEPELIAELLDIADGRAIVDERHRRKQPDWTFNPRDSGTVPVERYASLAPPWRV
ncbi:MAG TPA: NADH-ubiquinone oxidoreductase-F iron-sulfur binding region domain-containing protein [Acidimicrobiales bacterium]|nr:NADH-ubiquinone oxidoreductase-F iron-sulfur binding region domain-containing protein [Acidimicrobiales bacterium]